MNNSEEKEPIRVVLAEPQPVSMRGTLRELDAPDIEVIATTTSGTETVDLIHHQLPDVAVVAMQFRDISGIEILQKSKEAAPILFFTQEESEDVVFEAMMMGARGYLLKWYTDIALPEAVRRIVAGGLVMGSDTLKVFIKAIQSRIAVRQAPSMLTPREREILTLISEGHRINKIAPVLGLQDSTVQSHVKNTYRKLGVNSQAQAVREAMRLGLIGTNPEDPRTSGSGLHALARPS